MKLQNKNIDIIKKRDYTLIIEREKNDLNGNARYKVIVYNDEKLYKDDGSLNEYYGSLHYQYHITTRTSNKNNNNAQQKEEINNVTRYVYRVYDLLYYRFTRYSLHETRQHKSLKRN